MSTPFDAWAGPVLAWLATYLVHSTLLLCLAALAARPLERRSILAKEAVWRVALLGALLTATLQLAAGREPLAGQWRLAATPPAAREAVSVPGGAASMGSTASMGSMASMGSTTSMGSTAPAAGTSAAGLVLGLWAAGALFLALRLGGSWLHLRRSLRPRLEIVGGTLSRLLASLARETGFGRAVRLTCAYRLPVPVALGVRRPEISVPPRALSHLEPEQQESLLAHELAHLARRDPLWLVAVQLVTTAFFFQPLNWLARRRLREISELLCDEWAVGRTGRPVTLARCLAEVARWPFEAHRALPVPGIGGGSTQLAHRIRRLLEGEGAPAGRRPRWLVPALGVLVLAVAALAPGFSARAQETAERAAALAAAEPAAAVEPELAGEPAEATEPPELGEPTEPTLAGAGAEARHLAREDEERAGDDDSWLSAEEREQLERFERDAERISREVEERIRPEMEKLEREIEARTSELDLSSSEMAKLEAEIDALTERMRPSIREIERITAEARERAGKDGLSAEDRETIAREARRMAESAKLSAPELAEIRRLGEEHAKLARELVEKNRPQIEAARAEMMKQAEVIREQVRREIEPEIRALREQHRKVHQRRREVRRDVRHEVHSEVRREVQGEKHCDSADESDLDADPEVDVDAEAEAEIEPEIAAEPEIVVEPKVEVRVEPKVAEPPR